MSYRFVMLFHKVAPAYLNLTGRQDHFDLMIESTDDAGLITWTMSQNPFEEMDATAPVAASSAGTQSTMTAPAFRIENHRSDYLTYEGPVSNDRGHVTRVAEGEAKWIRNDEAVELELTFNATVFRVQIEEQQSTWTVNR